MAGHYGKGYPARLEGVKTGRGVAAMGAVQALHDPASRVPDRSVSSQGPLRPWRSTSPFRGRPTAARTGPPAVFLLHRRPQPAAPMPAEPRAGTPSDRAP